MKNFFLLLILVFVIFYGKSSDAQQTKNQNFYPFFYKGDGIITIKNLHNGRVAKIKYIDGNGNFNSTEFEKVNTVFGFPSHVLEETISKRLITFLDYFTDQYQVKDKTIYMTSGYRSPKYNNNLRKKGRTAAKTSTHIDGMALDFYVNNIDGKELWEKIRHENCCGVGHYGGKNIHLDSGRPRFWQQATSKVWSKESDYNRKIYLSTEYDRYRTNQDIRLFFTSISDFGFGIKKTGLLVDENNNVKKKIKLSTPKASNQKGSCLTIESRKEARFIYGHLPKNIKKGKYQIQLEFCEKVHKLMPDQKTSNTIEIL